MNKTSSKVHALLIQSLDDTRMIPLLPTQSKWILSVKSLLAIGLLLLSGFWARAGNVLEQPHNGSGTLLTSSRYQPNGTDYDQYVWNSFSVPMAQAVTEIRWRGGYDPQMAYWGGDIVNFRVSIYESTPGLSQPHLGLGYPGTPATLIAYDTGNNAGETSAGLFGGAPMYDFHPIITQKKGLNQMRHAADAGADADADARATNPNLHRL